MPIYDYICLNCKYEFSVIKKVDKDGNSISRTSCSKCDGFDLKKKLTSCGVRVDYKDSKEMYERVIKPDAKKIADKIRAGDEDAAADVFGEDKVFGS